MSTDDGTECRVYLTDRNMEYAATARCKCGAGLAHPMDSALAQSLRSWACSAVLKAFFWHDLHGSGKADRDTKLLVDPSKKPDGEHEAFDFAFYKIREETSVNNMGGHTTRPPGTVARTVGHATCPKCNHQWKSEPYDASGGGSHWRSGPCPECGWAVGGGISWSTSDGPAIDKRYKTVILDAPCEQS